MESWWPILKYSYIINIKKFFVYLKICLELLFCWKIKFLMCILIYEKPKFFEIISRYLIAYIILLKNSKLHTFLYKK